MNNPLYLASLRALAALGSHEAPALEDEALIRGHYADQTTPLDELACQAVNALLERKAAHSSGDAGTDSGDLAKPA